MDDQLIKNLLKDTEEIEIDEDEIDVSMDDDIDQILAQPDDLNVSSISEEDINRILNEEYFLTTQSQPTQSQASKQTEAQEQQVNSEKSDIITSRFNGVSTDKKDEFLPGMRLKDFESGGEKGSGELGAGG